MTTTADRLKKNFPDWEKWPPGMKEFVEEEIRQALNNAADNAKLLYGSDSVIIGIDRESIRNVKHLEG